MIAWETPDARAIARVLGAKQLARLDAPPTPAKQGAPAETGMPSKRARLERTRKAYKTYGRA
jgi:hypothetical protein